MPQRRRSRTAPQSSWQFEIPVPDISQIGNYRRDTISDRDRAAINRTLPAEIDREKLWVQLEPVIRETRSPKEIVAVLESTNCALKDSIRTLNARNDRVTAQSVQRHLTVLEEALRYYSQLLRRQQAGPRLRKFRIMRAWVEAGGRPTVATPDDPERMEGERRGTGEPSGPLVDYLQTAFRIICGEHLTPYGVKWFLYETYLKHFRFQYAGSELSVSSGLRTDCSTERTKN